MATISNLKIYPIEENKAIELLSVCGSWRQYPAYAVEAAKRVSANSLFFVINVDNNAIALANLRSRSLPFGLGSSELISHGPVLLRSPEFWQIDLDHALEALSGLARQTGQEIRIDPDPVWQMCGVTPTLPKHAFEDRHSRPYRTIVLPIADGLDAVRQRLHGKWRNILKQAEKANLHIVVSADPADFARMDSLLEELISRKGFSINQDPAFFARAASAAQGSERLMITLVLDGDEVVSAHIGAYSGQMACYLLGATNARGRQLRAAYAAQWAAIGTAIELGQQWYDLGGIDPIENPDVYHFKKRMGGQELETGRTIVLPAGGWRAYSTSAARLAWRLLSR